MAYLIKRLKKVVLLIGISITLLVWVNLIEIEVKKTAPSSISKLSPTLERYFSKKRYGPVGTLQAPAVVLKIKGGMGNQLFQYACSYALARKYGWPLYTVIPSTLLNASDPFQRNFGVKDRPFALDKFNIPLEEWNTIKEMDWGRISSTLASPIVTVTDSELLLSPTYSPDRVIQLHDDHYCQSEAYFSDYKDELVELLQPRGEPSPVVQHWTRVIEQDERESVAVHVRRGDMVPWGQAVPISYFTDSMKTIGRLLKGIPLTFYVFSDDISSVKTELGQQQQFDEAEKIDIQFVSDPERLSSLQDFYLMTRCKHGIISMSSYSWWAAYLIGNPEKKVIGSYHNRPSTTGLKQFPNFLYFYFSYPKSWFTVDPFGIFSSLTI